ncbi:MAG TPA: HAD family phosphatase [Kofleriaceae bacterium]|nr:HAD family phosphatase [Kofleriaceae bacterium]
MPAPRERAVVFDLGGVLIDWNPRYLYRKLLPEAEVEALLATVCTQAWNEQQDAGRTVAEATAELVARFPDQEALIRAYYARWDEMLGGLIAGTAAIVEELHARGVPLYALSNWSAETFHHARDRYAVLARFRAIVVSGEEKLIKPDARIFQLLFARHRVEPTSSIFIDDVERNVDAARRLGMTAIHFESPAQLRAELARLGLLEGG